MRANDVMKYCRNELWTNECWTEVLNQWMLNRRILHHWILNQEFRTVYFAPLNFAPCVSLQKSASVILVISIDSASLSLVFAKRKCWIKNVEPLDSVSILHQEYCYRLAIARVFLVTYIETKYCCMMLLQQATPNYCYFIEIIYRFRGRY